MIGGWATARQVIWDNQIQQQILLAERGSHSLGVIETRPARITSWARATMRAPLSQTTMLIGFRLALPKMLIISGIVKVSTNRIT